MHIQCDLLQLSVWQAKPKSSFSSLSNAFSSVLSVSSSARSPPELVPEQELATCSGNWLSHLDWDGQRCALSGRDWDTLQQLAVVPAWRWPALRSDMLRSSSSLGSLQQLASEAGKWLSRLC